MIGVVMLLGVDFDSNFAHIWRARGKVYIVRDGSVSEARKGTSLKVGDVVRVGDRSFAAIKYYDGSYVKLASGTLLKIKEPAGLYLSKGRIFSRIKKKLGKKGFYVATQTIVAGVRGTKFEVNVDSEGEVKVSVYDGRVEVVDLKTMKKQLVLEGKALKLSVEEGMKELEVDTGEMKDFWKNQIREAKTYEKELRKTRKEAMENVKEESMEAVRELNEEVKEELAEVKKEADLLESELEEYKDSLDKAMDEFQKEMKNYESAYPENSMNIDGDYQDGFPSPGGQ